MATLGTIAIAAYIAAMYWASANYDPTPRYSMPGIPNSEIILRPFDKFPDSGFAARGYDIYFKDSANKPGEVVLYEDGKQLGPASSYVDVVQKGMGRFTHIMGSVPVFIFSASDNTDPHTNGRKYWAVRRPK